jgi:hypothetical protein
MTGLPLAVMKNEHGFQSAATLSAFPKATANLTLFVDALDFCDVTWNAISCSNRHSVLL